MGLDTNFWLVALFIVCFTVISLTPKIENKYAAIYRRLAVVGAVMLIVCAILNFIFW